MYVCVCTIIIFIGHITIRLPLVCEVDDHCPAYSEPADRHTHTQGLGFMWLEMHKLKIAYNYCDLITHKNDLAAFCEHLCNII